MDSREEDPGILQYLLHGDPNDRKESMIRSKAKKASRTKGKDAKEDALNTRFIMVDESSPKHGPSRLDLAYVSITIIVLATYMFSVLYVLYDPLDAKLPAADLYKQPIDVSNVGIKILSPRSDADISLPVKLVWRLENYPVEPLHKYGSEMFEFKVFVNGQLIRREVSILQPPLGAEEILASNVTDKTMYLTYQEEVHPGLLVEGGVNTFYVEATFAHAADMLGTLYHIYDDVRIDTTRLLNDTPQIYVWSEDRAANKQPFSVRYLAMRTEKPLMCVFDGNLEYSYDDLVEGLVKMDELAPGRHTFQMRAQTAEGETVQSNVLAFEVDGVAAG